MLADNTVYDRHQLIHISVPAGLFVVSVAHGVHVGGHDIDRFDGLPRP